MQNKLDKDFFKLCFNLPPEEAIKFLEKKDLKVSVDWFDVYREEHVRAFTVAGITKLDVLNDVRNALVEAQKNGETLETFKQNIIPKLRQKGWYGNRLVIRKDGSEKEVNVSSPWRLKTIYRTNMAVAAMTGLYKELKAASDIMPYWRYVTVGDGRVREEHAKIHGKILRHDDPFWDNYFPPNGYNCRCSVEGITETEFKRKDYKLSDGKSMANLVMPFVKTGWDYNPGKEYYKPKPEEYSEELKPIAEKITNEADKMADSIKGNDIKVNEPVMDITKVEKPADYEEAKSIEAAEEYAVNTIGVKRASFKGLALDIVNEFNYALKKAVEKYPKIKDYLSFVGEIQERLKFIKELAYKEWFNKYPDSWDKARKEQNAIIDSFNDIKNFYQDDDKKSFLSTISRDAVDENGTRAYSKDAYGIAINAKLVKSLTDFNEFMKECNSKKMYSTDSFRGAVFHEIGHIIDAILKLSDNEKIREMFYGNTQEDITEKLSEYSWNNDNSEKAREFVAEALAEYLDKKLPREVAENVGKIADDEYNKE